MSLNIQFQIFFFLCFMVPPTKKGRYRKKDPGPILATCTYENNLQRNFLEKLVLGIDLAMAEKKSVKLAGDYNLNYFAKLDRSLPQSVFSPYDLKPSKIDTALRITFFNNSYRLHHNRRLRRPTQSWTYFCHFRFVKIFRKGVQFTNHKFSRTGAIIVNDSIWF